MKGTLENIMFVETVVQMLAGFLMQGHSKIIVGHINLYFLDMMKTVT